LARPKKISTTLIQPEPSGVLYGYCRVSTSDQAEKYGLDIQRNELLKQGVSAEHIFSDIESGAVRERPQLVRLFDIVKQGDTIIIPKLDRLARSTLHLLQIVEQLEQKGVMFKSINDPIDTTTPQGKMFFTIMGAVAEFERSIIKERTRKGIQAKIAENYKEKGRALWGRKPTSPVKLDKAKEDLINGKSHKNVAELYSIPKPTLYRLFPAKVIEQLQAERLAEKNKDNHDIFESTNNEN
jgi:DNA invertase Pin-like site-specific DNA recombinase